MQQPPHMLRGCLWLVLATSFAWMRASEAKTARCTAPVIHTKPENIKLVTIGRDVSLVCRISRMTRGTTYQWYKNGQNLNSENNNRMQVKSMRFLKIKKVNLNDNGNYTCIAKSPCGQVNATIKVVVKKGIRSKLFIEPIANVTAKEGQNVTIACISEAMGNFIWLRWRSAPLNHVFDIIRQTPNKYNITVQKKKFTFQVNLTLINVTKESEGKYSFAISSSIGHNTVDVYLTVITDAGTKPTEGILATPFIEPIANVTAKEGQNVTITCNAISDNLLDFKWLRWTRSFPFIEIIRQKTNKYNIIVQKKKFAFTMNLTLINVTKKSEGKYSCVITNSIGHNTVDVYLKVITDAGTKPTVPSTSTSLAEDILATPIIEPIANVTAKEGQNVTIACISEAMGNFVWLRWQSAPFNRLFDIIRQTPNKYNITVQKKKFTFHVNLTLINVTKESEGKYSCVMFNSIGQNTVDMYLKVITDAGTKPTASPTKITSLGAPPKFATNISHENNGSVERPFSVDVAEPLQDHTASDKE